MKRNYLILVLLGLLVSQSLFAQGAKSTFAPGDWFECEMEFRNNMPVFRNNEALLEKDDHLQYVSLRFTCAAVNTADSTSQWSYQVLRYKDVMASSNEKETKVSNVYSFDSWYPDYFAADFDSIRNSLRGEVIVYSGQVEHQYKYAADFSLHNFLPMKFPDERLFGAYYSSSLKYGAALPGLVEKMATLIFTGNRLKADESLSVNDWTITSDPQAVDDNSRSFTLRSGYAKSPLSYKAYFLQNGLPFAFLDDHRQQVMVITKANFPLPNQAEVKVIDRRRKLKLRSQASVFTDLITIRAANSAFVMNESGDEGFISLKANEGTKNYALKCGTAFRCYAGGGPVFKLFVEPGDHIQVVLTDDGTSIEGSQDSQWWNSQAELNPETINAAPVSEEFRAYLRLVTKIASVYDKIEKLASDEFRTLLLDYFSLKSYHYKAVDQTDFLDLLTRYDIQKDNLVSAAGFPGNGGFDFEYYKNIIQNAGFPLYFELSGLLTGQFGYTQLGKSDEKYQDFLKHCGDTLFTTNIEHKMAAFNSVQIGKHLPFTSLLTENEQEAKILPAKGKYGLLLLYDEDDRDREDFVLLADSLPESIQTASYRIRRYLGRQSTELLPETSLSKAGHLELYGQPLQSKKLCDITVRIYTAVLILYDEHGKIIYNEAYGPDYDRKDYITRFKSGILKAIENDQKQEKDSAANLWLIIGLSLVLGGGLSALIYRIRIRRINKRNAQQQLLQELKLKSVQSQLNPHFIFNALNSIQQLINTEQTELAGTYLIGFSNLLRGVLQNADKKLVPLSDELQMVERYLELEQLRLNFNYEIVVDNKIDIGITEVPYMLFQPLIENSIKHGVAKVPENGKVKLEIDEKDGVLLVRISDSGPGFSNLSLEQIIGRTGKGLKLVQEKLMNIYGDEGLFSVANQDEGSGAVVLLNLKIG